MKFNSKPHSIEGFQFIGKGTVYPDWAKAEIEKGRAFIVINNKDQYFEIIARRGSLKAFMDEWICKNSSGNIFVLSDAELLAGFHA